MTLDRSRRRLVQLSIAALSTLAAGAAVGAGGVPVARATGSVRDFDFFLGRWNVRHRRLGRRLVRDDTWETFDGTTTCQSLLDGAVNLNESIAHRASGTTRGMGLRAFDAATGTWRDWYFSAADPTSLGVPSVGRFAHGVGTFLSDETYEGRPVKVRGIFTPIAPGEAQWEQAFSPDGGASWETNWVMRYSRVG